MNLMLQNLICEYWDCGFLEGQEGRKHDTPDGAAQRVWGQIEAEVAKLEAIEGAARRVLDAFTAYGKASGVVDNLESHRECEAAMTALAVAVDEDRYTLTDAGRAALGKKP